MNSVLRVILTGGHWRKRENRIAHSAVFRLRQRPLWHLYGAEEGSKQDKPPSMLRDPIAWTVNGRPCGFIAETFQSLYETRKHGLTCQIGHIFHSHEFWLQLF